MPNPKRQIKGKQAASPAVERGQREPASEEKAPASPTGEIVAISQKQPTEPSPPEKQEQSEQSERSEQSEQSERSERSERSEQSEKPRYKPLPVLESATNESGEVFTQGDKIQVKAPWGARAIAKITGIYQDNEGNAWAQYTSSEPLPPNWKWEGGVTRASRLVQAVDVGD